MIHSHQDIIGVAGFLHRQEFKYQANVADNFNVWKDVLIFCNQPGTAMFLLWVSHSEGKT
jgi:hypothetical protein